MNVKRRKITLTPNDVHYVFYLWAHRRCSVCLWKGSHHFEGLTISSEMRMWLGYYPFLRKHFYGTMGWQQSDHSVPL